MTIIRPTTINARFSQPVGLGGEKLWLCPTLGGDRLDLSGNGNHGTYQGGMGTVADKYKGSKAYKFDGVDDRISLVDNAIIQSTSSPFSTSTWVKMDSSASSAPNFPYRNLYSFGYSRRASGFPQKGYESFFVYDPGSFYIDLRLTNWDNSYGLWTRYTLTTSPNNSWLNVSVTYDGSLYAAGLKLFLDGTELTATVLRDNLSDTSLVTYGSPYIGFAVDKYSFGLQDDLRVYNRTLTHAEVKHLASYRGVLGSPRQPYDPLKRTVVRVPAAIPAATKVGSIKKPTTIIKPSYQAGYARNASESENPNLWDGLVGAWMPSLGVTGETLRDVSGNGNHGTLTNMDAATDWVTSRNSKALNYNGSVQRVQIDAANCLSFPQQDFSISVWIKSQGLISSSKGILTKGDSLTSGEFTLHTYSNLIVFRLIDVTTGAYIGVQSPTLSGDEWHHIVAMSDKTETPSGMRFFQNGVEQSVQVASSAGTFNGVQQTDKPLKIAARSDSQVFVGDISDLLLYKKLLSPQEIKQLYVDSLAPFRRKQRVSVAVPAAVAPSATYHPLRSLAHPLEQ